MTHALSNRFLLLGVAAGLCGMALGMVMAARQDFTLMPAHAHLNLLGWVAMFLYGLFYRAVPEAARGALPRLQFWLAAIGLLVMVPALAFVLTGHAEAEPVVALGSLLVLLALLTFGAVLIRAARSPAPSRSDLLTAAAGE